MGRTDNNSKYKKKNFFQMKEGDVVLRILPPLNELKDAPNLGALAAKKIWSKFHSVHFGYKNMEGKLRTFESPATKVEGKLPNGKTGKVLVPGSDPALDRIEDLKAKLETAKTVGNAPLAAKLTALVGMKGNYNIDNNHHMNVVDLQGNIGVLKIRHKAKTALDEEIKKLEGKGIDPLSVNNGRFFVFTRTGSGNETNFKVSVYVETVDHPDLGQVDKPVVHKLTPDILSRIATEAADLDEVAVKLTTEEVAQIVATSDLLTGKSPKCDEYFDARWKAKKAATEAQEESSNECPDETETSSTRNAAPTAETAPTQTTAPTTPAAQTLTPTPQAAATATPTPAPVKAQGQAVEELSDADFFAQIGEPQVG